MAHHIPIGFFFTAWIHLLQGELAQKTSIHREAIANLREHLERKGDDSDSSTGSINNSTASLVPGADRYYYDHFILDQGELIKLLETIKFASHKDPVNKPKEAIWYLRERDRIIQIWSRYAGSRPDWAPIEHPNDRDKQLLTDKESYDMEILRVSRHCLDSLRLEAKTLSARLQEANLDGADPANLQKLRENRLQTPSSPNRILVSDFELSWIHTHGTEAVQGRR